MIVMHELGLIDIMTFGTCIGLHPGENPFWQGSFFRQVSIIVCVKGLQDSFIQFY